MIHIDFSLAVSLYIIFSACLVIGVWIFYNLKGGESLPVDSHNLHVCPYCAYLFIDYESQALRVCPRCESYMTPEDEAALVQKNANKK